MKKMYSFLLILGIVLSTVVMPAVSTTTANYSEKNLTSICKPNSDWAVETRTN